MRKVFYRFLLLIFILCTITFLSLTTMAVEVGESNDIEKTKKQEKIKIGQNRRSSNIVELLNANNDYSEPNKATIEQIGYNNDAIINQYGKGNIAEIYQHGNKDYAYIYQNGKNNEAFIDQFIDQEGTEDRYKAEIIQEGTGHDASITQPGDGRDITIFQNGNNNSVDSNILNSLNNFGSVRIEQIGNNMNLSVDALLGN